MKGKEELTRKKVDPRNMEETLTDSLVRVREDLSQLKKVRDYLDTNAETEERCSLTWKTVEAFNSILSVCSSQNSPETNALDTLLDSFYYLARNNSDDSVWDDFGFELGIICVKVLSAIERSDVFEILFCKLLSVISVISEHNSSVWKSTGRQILNVLINKKVSLPYLEAILKLYICILKNIESTTLHDFSTQNLHLLKTLSLSVQKLGDFEIQSNFIELIFLHLSKNGKLMSDFFSTEKPLRFNDFENDCRLYLNELNKPRRGIERKIYSICGHVLYLGGCFVEPPLGKNCIWVDANKDSERVTFKYGDVESSGDRIISIHFTEIVNVQLENDKTDGNRCLTIQTKTLMRIQKDVRNNDVCVVVENTEEVYQFIHFLKSVIGEKKKNKKFEGRSSKTVDFLLIDRNKRKMEVQDNSITSSERHGIDYILPDVLSLFERANQAVNKSKTSRVTKVEEKTPPKPPGVVLESQELSPNSFVESLNKHIGLGSPELRHTFEDSVETVEFLQKSTPGGHKLFRSPEKIFEMPEATKNPNVNFIFGENKENHPVGEVIKPKIKTYTRTPSKTTEENVRVPKERKPLVKLSNSQSQDYFQGHLHKKKPSLPKLKRTTKSIKNPVQIVGKETKKVTNKTCQLLGEPKTGQKESENPIKQDGNQKQQQDKLRKEHNLRKPAKPEPKQRNNSAEKSKHVQQKQEIKQRKQSIIETKTESKPSLLDPNGYAYRRWCQPTTSERSNFWLKKLREMEKPKSASDSIFDFSEEIFGEKKRIKRVIRSKPKSKTKPNKMTLRQAKEIFKKSPAKPKLSPKVQREVPEAPETPPQIETPVNSPQTNLRVSPELLKPTEDSEYESFSENEEPQPQTKKRDRSDGDSSSARRYTKKKPKVTLPSHVISILRLRLRKAEDRDKQTTDDIIQTIRKSTDHLFNHLCRKNGEKIIPYLRTAEAACTVFSGEIDEMEFRAKRMQRAVVYFKAGCTISDTHEVLDDQFSRLRASLKEFKQTKDTSKTIDRVSERLSNLIKSGIQELINNEWETRRNRLLRCASILGIDLECFQGIL